MELITRAIDFQDTLTLEPCFDIHLGARGCDEREFARFIERGLSTPDWYTWFGGDVVDGVFKKDLRFDGASTKDEMLDVLDSMLNAQVRYACQKIRPLVEAGKVLGIGKGNHEYTVQHHNSFDITMALCEKMGTANLGYSTLMRLCLQKRGSSTRNLVIYSHHGWGGGRKPGASVNKLMDQVAMYDADIFVMGHDHQKMGKKMPRIGITASGTPRLVNKTVVLVRAGTFLKTLEEGSTSYAERAGYPPTDIGTVSIAIDIVGTHKNLEMRVTE